MCLVMHATSPSPGTSPATNPVLRPFLAALERELYRIDDPDSRDDLLTTFAACEFVSRAFSRRSIEAAALVTAETLGLGVPRVVDPATLRMRNRWHRLLADSQRGRVLVRRWEATGWLMAFRGVLPRSLGGDDAMWRRHREAAEAELKAWVASTVTAWTIHAEGERIEEPTWPADWLHRFEQERERLVAAGRVAASAICNEQVGPEAVRVFTIAVRQLRLAAGFGMGEVSGGPALAIGSGIQRLAELEEAMDWHSVDGADGLAEMIRLCSRLRAGRVQEAAAELRHGGWLQPMNPPIAGENVAMEPQREARAVQGRRFAVIDVGSNAVRLLAVTVDDAGQRKTLTEGRVPTTLGQGMASGSGLSEAAIQDTARAVDRFVERARELGCERIGIFATAAVREATNALDFTGLIQARTGIAVEILSSRQEGIFAFRGADLHRASSDVQGIVDIGGGSAQIVLARRGVIVSNLSLPLGAVRLTEQFGAIGPGDDAAFQRMRTFVEESIEEAIPAWWTPIETIVGCGGGFTACVAVESAAAQNGVQIERLQRATIREWLKRLRMMTPDDRAKVPGLPGDRARIAIAGLCVADSMMKLLGASAADMAYSGVRGGLIDRMITETELRHEPLAAAAMLAERCDDDPNHRQHVAGLAVSLFDQLAGLGLIRGDARERNLLEVAAIVHDIGILAAYSKHHKWGREMVRNQPIDGLTDSENEVISQVVRYHRKAGPSDEHRGLAELSTADAATVCRLAGVLRVADGLDRLHVQNVRSTRVRRDDGCVVIEVTAEGDAAENVRAAMGKADVLSEVLELPIEFEM